MYSLVLPLFLHLYRLTLGHLNTFVHSNHTLDATKLVP